MGLICKWKWAGLRFQAHFNQWQCISRNLKESGRGPFSLTGRLPTWSATAFVTSPFPRSGEWIGWPPRLRDPLRVWPPWWCGFSAAPRWCRSDLQRGLGQTLEGLWPHILWSHAGPRCASASLEPSLSRWGWVRQTGVGEPCRLVGGMWTCGKVLGGQFFILADRCMKGYERAGGRCEHWWTRPSTLLQERGEFSFILGSNSHQQHLPCLSWWRIQTENDQSCRCIWRNPSTRVSGST